ncbi:GIY-YIG nuclease family protein [Streptomyces sp. Vc74B-19]|uniref:hypothetical protein n=1 Tax=Streptomyces sp. Vc74B-19 TaxID=2741324 RepID=UPI001BFCA866|nr:hypothetical protein [Streptomyces sp. Vc74B-19]MBT3161522.1 GIY-YIG nuclease family protein [Streptomyces sp. Vc74B-19]
MADITATAADPAKPKRRADSIRAEACFLARLTELGATLVEPAYLGTNRHHRVICAGGHECTARPDEVNRGRGFCRTCAGQDSKAAAAAFQARVEASGGVVLDDVWKGVRGRYRVRCAVGHVTTPRAQDVQSRGGICAACSKRDPRAAEARFRTLLADRGATLLDDAWRGANTRYRIRCAAGHENEVRPGNVHRGGVCKTCSGQDSAAAEAAFRARVTELGGTLLDPWKGALAPHRVRCAAGHMANPWPTSVNKGYGICRTCAGKTWDVFYVVRDGEQGIIKFGITSGDPRPRLRDHAVDGFTQVVRLHRNLPDEVAPGLERTVLAALRDAREMPVRGREYFWDRTLQLVLDLVDNHPRI